MRPVCKSSILQDIPCVEEVLRLHGEGADPTPRVSNCGGRGVAVGGGWRREMQDVCQVDVSW